MRLSTRAGGPVWALENVRLIEGENGRPGSLEAILLDITDRKRTEQEMEFRAYHDPLTGLPNRALFDDRLRLALAQARRSRALMAVMFLDVDDPSSTTRSGTHRRSPPGQAEREPEPSRGRHRGPHRRGRVHRSLPEIDSEAAAGSPARSGAVRAFPRRRRRSARHRQHRRGPWPSDGDDVEGLSRTRMERCIVKEEGGNGFQLCSRTSSSKALGRLSIEQQLRRALDHGEFVSYYQPIGRPHAQITSVEALVRGSTRKNVIEPSGFISPAEYSGLVIPMGRRLREACLG